MTTRYERTRAAALACQGSRDWYAQARRLIAAEAARVHVKPEYFADVLAITSPRISVSRNWYLTVGYCRTLSENTMMRSTRAALAHWRITGVIRGPKTGPFARALRGDESAIVLDTWMAAFFRCEQSEFDTKRRGKYEQTIRQVANDLGWTNCQVQAAVWCWTVTQYRRNPGFYPSQIALFDRDLPDWGR
jgi:hypothetical protein